MCWWASEYNTAHSPSIPAFTHGRFRAQEVGTQPAWASCPLGWSFSWVALFNNLVCNLIVFNYYGYAPNFKIIARFHNFVDAIQALIWSLSWDTNDVPAPCPCLLKQQVWLLYGSPFLPCKSQVCGKKLDNIGATSFESSIAVYINI